MQLKKFFSKMILFFCVIFFTQNLFANQNIKIPENADFWSNYPHEELASFIVDNMTDEELLAQILMFGWAGSEPSELLLQWIKLRSLGSVKVYGWSTNNVKDVAKSVIKVQEESLKGRFKIPLYVATDQEGGWIRHIKGRTSDTPGNLAIGATGLASDAYYSGYYIAKELRAMGINMNFAPTVDIYTNLNSTVIGPRAFSSNALDTGILGASYSQGVIDAGLIPTAKHFPGHGDTSDDSHGHLPEIQIDFNTLQNRELLPFKFLVDEKIPAIMSGHLSFPQITKNGEPATLSKYFLTKVLRQDMGYEGLIITDDMMMNGATLYAGSLSKAVRMAIEAGNDIVISSTTANLYDSLWTSNLSLMSRSSEFKQTVKTAARRVILSKLKYFKGENFVPIYPDLENIEKLVPDPEGTKFFLNQACKSITAYNKPANSYKIQNPNEQKILIAGQYQDFLEEGLKRFPNAKTLRYNYNMGPNETAWTGDKIYSEGLNYDTIIIGCANDKASTVAKRVNQLTEKGKNVIIISIMSPVYFMKEKWNSSILLCYSYSPFSFKASFSVLAGDFEPTGYLPLLNN